MAFVLQYNQEKVWQQDTPGQQKQQKICNTFIWDRLSNTMLEESSFYFLVYINCNCHTLNK